MALGVDDTGGCLGAAATVQDGVVWRGPGGAASGPLPRAGATKRRNRRNPASSLENRGCSGMGGGFVGQPRAGGLVAPEVSSVSSYLISGGMKSSASTVSPANHP